MKKYLSIFFLVIALGLGYAHESRPLYVQIENDSEGLVIKLTVPNTVAQNNLPTLILPDGYVLKEQSKITYIETSGYTVALYYEKRGGDAKDAEARIVYPKFNPAITSIIQINEQGQEEMVIVLPPEETKFTIGGKSSGFAVSKQYTWLGITHIWAGIDHLLFLICLFIITGFNKKLLWTITGFTLAHSITLVMSTLGWVQLPIAPVEACIALSIIFLCCEIVKHHQTKQSLTYRYPVIVSSSFGLLHGFGFASVLADIGLPRTHLINALLFFNIGVEVGQLMFLATVVIAQAILFKLIKDRIMIKKYGVKWAIYGVGILASFWFFDRLL